MAIINIERVDDENSRNQNNEINAMNNLGNINDKFNSRKNDFIDNSGMDGDRLKREGKILKMCLSTLFGLIIFFAIIGAIIYIVLKYSGYKIEIFQTLTSYSKYVYNNVLIKCYLILSALLLFACLFVKISINTSIRRCFKARYLKKIGIYIYDIFLSFLNIAFYIMVAYIFFIIVNNIYTNIINLSEIGKIAESVNLEAINHFKWIIVVVISIFGVLNCFTGINIVHKKNRFILEDTFDE